MTVRIGSRTQWAQRAMRVGLATLLLAVAGCTGQTAQVPPLPSPPVVSAAGPDILRIQHAGALRAAVDLSYPPIAYRDDRGPKGLDIDLATLLAQALGVRLTVTDTPIAVLRAGVPADADVALGALPPGAVPGRASSPYYTFPQAIASHGRSPVHDLAGLRGLRVAAVAGSPGADAARASGASTVEGTYLAEQALVALSAGEVQAAVVDEPLARGYAADHRDVSVSAAGGGTVGCVIVTPLREPDLASFVSEALTQLDRTGGLSRLRERAHL